MNAKRLVLSSLVVLMVSKASATGLIAGATEPTQIVNMMQLVMSYVEQVQQTVTQMQQYQTMLKNLQTLTPSGMLDQQAQALWQNQGMDQTFANLRQIVVGGNSVAFSLGAMDSNFKRLHPGYNGYTSNGVNFNQAYANWSDNTLKAVKNSTSMIGIQSQSLQNEQSYMSELRARSASAGGQLQALQAGNDIGAAMVGQLQNLRALTMAQMDAQNQTIAAEQSRQDASDEVLKKFVTRQQKPIETFEQFRARTGK